MYQSNKVFNYYFLKKIILIIKFIFYLINLIKIGNFFFFQTIIFRNNT